jgi:hypothetical protein
MMPVMMVPVVMMMMMMMMGPPVVPVVMMIEARRCVVAGAGVIALTDPLPAVPDRAAGVCHILDEATGVAGEARVGCPRQGLRATSGKRARESQDSSKHQATHSHSSFGFKPFAADQPTAEVQ